MRDLSDRVPGLAVSSQGAGNTTSDSASLSMTAPGSAGVDAFVPEPLDVLPPPAGPVRDYAPLIAPDGARGTRPGDDGGWTRPGADTAPPWRLL